MSGRRAALVEARARRGSHVGETVASHGVTLRIVSPDADRERDLADLIASYERLTREWDQLFQRALDLLETKPRRRARCRSSKT
jgi:hypothetical protein